MINNTVMTLGEAIAEKRKTDVKAAVVYHDMHPVENQPGEFTLTSVHHVWYLKKHAEGQGDSAFTIGATVDYQEWFTKATKMLWICRWAAKGLMPCKACVVLTCKAQIPSGRAVKLVA